MPGDDETEITVEGYLESARLHYEELANPDVPEEDKEKDGRRKDPQE